MTKIIWVLDDNRAGNYAQSFGLATELANNLDAKAIVKNINYNSFARLPNFLKINGLYTISKNSQNEILNSDEKPSIIISAGRKAAPLLGYLKNKYQALVIQIMNPNFCFSKFDVVILPDHDKEYNAGNIIRITGSLTRVNNEVLIKEYQKFANLFENISSPKIALLVGGSSRKGRFTHEIAVNLGEVVSKITSTMNAHLLVLNSRRTGDEITEILDQNLNCSKHFFKLPKNNNNWKNPYFAVLQAADFIVATGDSIAMCSEVCSLGKPVYIFNPPVLCPPKHLKFHESLFTKGYAKRLDEKTAVLENFAPQKLDETKRVANLIIKTCNIFSKK